MARFRWATEAGAGFGTLGASLLYLSRHPRTWLRGMVPPLLASILLLTALVGVGVVADDIALWLTPFASSWMAWSAQALRALLALLLIVGAAVLLVQLFASITLAVGAPFYDSLSAEVDAARGREFAPQHRSAARLARDVVADSGANLGFAVLRVIPATLFSLVPVLGQLAGPIANGVLGSWALVLELMQPAAERRGLTRLVHRQRLLAHSRARVLGFGIPIYLIMLVPVLGAVIYPAAVVGATILVDDMERELRQLPPATWA